MARHSLFSFLTALLLTPANAVYAGGVIVNGEDPDDDSSGESTMSTETDFDFDPIDEPDDELSEEDIEDLEKAVLMLASVVAPPDDVVDLDEPSLTTPTHATDLINNANSNGLQTDETQGCQAIPRAAIPLIALAPVFLRRSRFGL